MSLASFKGKLLEEVLAYLIRNSGYQLLLDPRQDPDELGRQGSGLVVKGRGAVHQADVLGQLGWIPAFTFPIRLFVEAKWHEHSKTGLPEVRNAVGVLQDINQNYSVQNGLNGRRLMRRFNYTYSLFSTTGFSGPAEEMALAHLISLIDLSGSAFAELRSVVNDLGELLYGLFEGEDSVGEEEQVPVTRRSQRTLLTALRERLNTWPEDVPSSAWKDEQTITRLQRIEPQFESIINRIRAIGELFVGMANGPFLLVLKATEPVRFIRFADENPSHEVRFSFSESPAGEIQGQIAPLHQPSAYSLSFGLPRILEEHVLLDENRGIRIARGIKQCFLSEITVYRRDGERDILYRLVYNPAEAKEFRGTRRSR